MQETSGCPPSSRLLIGLWGDRTEEVSAAMHEYSLKGFIYLMKLSELREVSAASPQTGLEA